MAGGEDRQSSGAREVPLVGVFFREGADPLTLLLNWR